MTNVHRRARHEHRNGDHAEAEAVASLFKGSRADAVAEGRADVAAGRVYSADAVKRWMESWDTPDERERPEAEWRTPPLS